MMKPCKITTPRIPSGMKIAMCTLIVVPALLSGCTQGFGRYLDVYKTGLQTPVEMNGSSFLVNDRRDLHSLFIRGDGGKAGSANALDVWGDDKPNMKELYKSAVGKYLSDQGLKCTYGDGKYLGNSQYEFIYKCN